MQLQCQLPLEILNLLFRVSELFFSFPLSPVLLDQLLAQALVLALQLSPIRSGRLGWR